MEVEIFESAKKNLQIKKYLDTSVRGLKPGGGEVLLYMGFMGMCLWVWFSSSLL